MNFWGPDSQGVALGYLMLPRCGMAGVQFGDEARHLFLEGVAVVFDLLGADVATGREDVAVPPLVFGLRAIGITCSYVDASCAGTPAVEQLDSGSVPMERWSVVRFNPNSDIERGARMERCGGC